MRKTVGRYQMKAVIGSGGMATVYLALDPQFEREVAVKVLPRDLMNQTGMRERFTREAKVIASLEHPAIVPVYDFGEDEGQPYLVMRYLRGGNLKDRMEAGQVSLRHTVEVIRRISAALGAAHERDIIHRDVKPANILYDTHDNPHLSDFGIVKLGNVATTLTGEAVIGTPNYMSPEQARGDRDVDSRTDIYSLGVVLYELLTGKAPYESDTPMGVAIKHVTEPVPNIEKDRPDLSTKFNQLIQKAMAKDPDDRYQKVVDLRDALVEAASSTETIAGATKSRRPIQDTLLSEEPESAEATAYVPPPVDQGGGKRRPGLLWPIVGIVGIGTVLALGFVGVLLLRSGDEPVPTQAPSTEAAVVRASPTPPPPSPTSVPTEPSVDDPIVRADFRANSLDRDWRWVREDPAAWDLSSQPGWLTMLADDSTLLQEGGTSPVLLRWTAPGDFDLTTRVDFAPGQDFQAAGLIAYQDDDHLVGLARAFCTAGSGTCVGDGAYLDNDQAFISGALYENSASGLPSGEPVYLRLSRRGNLFEGYWSSDGEQWTLVAETTASLAYPRLGLYANGDVIGSGSLPARFEFLEFKDLDSQTDRELSAWTLLVPESGALALAVIDSSSGPAATASVAIQIGTEFAVLDFGFGDLYGRPVQLVPFASECSEAAGASAAQKIATWDHIIALIGPVCSTEVRGALPILDAARVSIVSPSATDSGLAPSPSVFNRVILHDSQPGSQLGLEANSLASVQEFYAEVEARSRTPLSQDTRHLAAYAYDATWIVLEALQRTAFVGADGSLVVDRRALLAAIRRTSGYNGLTGAISFEDDGDRALP